MLQCFQELDQRTILAFKASNTKTVEINTCNLLELKGFCRAGDKTKRDSKMIDIGQKMFTKWIEMHSIKAFNMLMRATKIKEGYLRTMI